MKALKIAPQGRFDGTCFAQCVSNGYKTIIAPENTLNAYSNSFGIEAKWRKFINIIPFSHNLLNGAGFTQGLSLELEAEVTFQLLHHAFLIFGGTRHRFKISSLSLAKLKAKSDYNKSVVILCARPNSPLGSHYVCIVGQDNKHLNLACSWAIYEGDYQEQIVPGTNRYYNSVLDRKHLNKKEIFNNFIFEVTLEDGQEPEP
jgi:hypothetical protein